MKTPPYLRVFDDQETAFQRMRTKNQAARAANCRDIYCLLEHPDGWAVADLATAIEIGIPYEWSF